MTAWIAAWQSARCPDIRALLTLLALVAWAAPVEGQVGFPSALARGTEYPSLQALDMAMVQWLAALPGATSRRVHLPSEARDRERRQALAAAIPSAHGLAARVVVSADTAGSCGGRRVEQCLPPDGVMLDLHPQRASSVPNRLHVSYVMTQWKDGVYNRANFLVTLERLPTGIRVIESVMPSH